MSREWKNLSLQEKVEKLRELKRERSTAPLLKARRAAPYSAESSQTQTIRFAEAESSEQREAPAEELSAAKMSPKKKANKLKHAREMLAEARARGKKADSPAAKAAAKADIALWVKRAKELLAGKDKSMKQEWKKKEKAADSSEAAE